MKTIKKLFCALLCAALVIGTFAGCHKKGEIGVTVTDSKLSEKTGKVEFTSAYYMCALIMSYNSGKSEVNQKYQDENKSTTDIDYFKEKIDKKKFNDWVIDNTEESLRKIAAYKIKCAQNKLTVKDEDKSSAEQYAEAYWTNTNYNYSEYFEPNGVSLDTYKAYMLRDILTLSTRATAKRRFPTKQFLKPCKAIICSAMFSTFPLTILRIPKRNQRKPLRMTPRHR